MALRKVDYKFAFKDGFSVHNCRLKSFSILLGYSYITQWNVLLHTTL